MAWEYKGNIRTPGPLGTVLGGFGGRIPGPLRFGHEDVKGSPTKAAKTFPMPPPAGGSSTIIRARAVDWALSKGSPIPEDVQQGELAVCPIAAIAAALAHTARGKRRLDSMITEYSGTSVKTTFSTEILDSLSSKTKDDPDYRPPQKEIVSKRYFSVTLDSKVEVSDVFYIKYTDGTDVNMVYMGSPKEALWPCVIEKAFATKIGSYEDLDDDTKHTVNEFWGILVGSKPQVLLIDDETDLGKISTLAKAAPQTPTIGASKDDAKAVLFHHGFAVLGLKGSDIELYDPHGKRLTVSLATFRKNFQAIFSGMPR